MASKLQAIWNGPTGLKTIHFWAPAFKWGLIVANIADLEKPPEEISYPTQAVNGFGECEMHDCSAMVVTGAIWARYSTVVIPRNMPLFSVSMGMAATGAYQLMRKYRHSESMDLKPSIAE